MERMNASASRISGFRHVVKVREHRLNIDEPVEAGGDDAAPSPQELLAASLASCTAVTMEMYAARKGWNLRDVEVACEYVPAERGCPTRFTLTLRLPSDLTDEQVQRLKVIATKCPVHRTLDGEVMFDERVERVQLAV
jgi:putative redox protein